MNIKLKPNEIRKVIQRELDLLKKKQVKKVEAEKTGTVCQVGDGIARIHVLTK